MPAILRGDLPRARLAAETGSTPPPMIVGDSPATRLGAAVVVAVGVCFGGPLAPYAGAPTAAPLPSRLGETARAVRPAPDVWRAITLAPARPAEPQWTGPIAARIERDETRVVALGAVVDGDVRSVFVDLGAAVRAGGPVFSIATARDERLVVAPRDGVVVEHRVARGTRVRRGEALVTIADPSTVWVRAEVASADVARLRRGTRARVTLPSAPAFRADAAVESIAVTEDPARRTVAVRVVLPNADGTLRPDMHAEVRFEAAPYDGSVEVALAAVRSDARGDHVHVERREGELVRRDVVVGAVREGRAVVVRGLEPGERVVERGADLVASAASGPR